MKNMLLISLIFPILTGCSSYNYNFEKQDEEPTEEISSNNISLVSSNSKSTASTDNVWTRRNIPVIKSKNINHYARGIMHELLSNLQYVGPSTPVAVADFVYLDGDYNSSPLIGKQLSQAFMHEVHKLGIPVVDHKLTDYIRVSTSGDIALSNDYLELSGEIPIRYVLTGTLLKDGHSTIVNARIVGIESKAIVASAQGNLPASVINDITTSQSNDGIY